MITLNINGVITLIKMQRLENGLKKKRENYLPICHSRKAHFRFKGTSRLKVKGWKIYKLKD